MVKESKIQEDLVSLWRLKTISEKNISLRLSKIKIFDNYSDAIKQTEAIAVLTEWEEFTSISFESVNMMSTIKPKIFDGRLILKDSNYTIGR